MENSLLKKGTVVVILLLFIGAGALPTVMSEEKQKTQSATTMQNIWYVDDVNCPSHGSGTQADPFCKIQYAINAASPNDEIRVYEGFYPENLIVNVNSLTFIGGWDQSGTSVIDGSGTGDVVNITADDVTIRGFTIQNSGIVLIDNDYDSGIQIWGNYSTITYNNITNNLAGITNMGYVGWYTGFNTLISCNTITDNVNRGIGFLYSENTIITCNKISNSNTVGIGGAYWTNCVISCNNISTQIRCNRAIVLQTCNNNEISCNSIWAPTASFGYGLLLYYNSNGNYVMGNTIQHTDVGIRVDNSSDPNWLYYNNLMDNSINAWDNNYMSANNWDTGSEGNYWDDLDDNDCKPDYCIYDMFGVKNAVDENPLLAPYICPYIPSTPTIDGPTRARAGDEHDYDFFSQDPKCDCLIYIVDWGDGNTSTSELVDDGTPTTLSHTWDQQGTYTIRAQAKSLCGGESGWGTLVVEMPKNKMLTNTLFLRFLEQHPHLFPILRLLLRL